MNEILNSELVKGTIKDIFGDSDIEVADRRAYYMIKLKNEESDKVTRILLLHPKGYTTHDITETSSHPESRREKITIKGGIRPNKTGFNLLKNVIKFAYYTKRKIETYEDRPYVVIDKNNPYYKEEIKSSRETFFAVKENGEGFYHILINLSDEWLLLILEKELRLQKEMDIKSKIKDLESDKQKAILELIETTENIGDKIFNEHNELVDRVLELDIDDALPALIEALNIYESGNNEPCTIFAIILKFAEKKNSRLMQILKSALETNEAPKYYLQELIEKVSNLALTH